MKARHKRLTLVLLGLTALGIAVWFVLSAFQRNLVFFFTPTQILSGEAPANRSFRVGGMVEKGSLKRQADGITATFVVTDLAQGKLGPDHTFVADEVLAKHDENYMPPEAAYALKQAQARQEAQGGKIQP
jgi:cytochrome c-type biogenesis protein CcmE